MQPYYNLFREPRNKDNAWGNMQNAFIDFYGLSNIHLFPASHIRREPIYASWPYRLIKLHPTHFRVVFSLIGVKVQFHDYLEWDNGSEVKKGIKLIGPDNNIKLALHIINKYYRYIYRQWQKKVYSSKIITEELDNITNNVLVILEVPTDNAVTEKYILNNCRFEYKKYKAKEIRYHFLVTKKYVNKMFLN